MQRDTGPPRGGYGMWTEAFELLHHAATTGASVEEIERLETAELDELHTIAPTEWEQRP
jgi:hypothetical protein